MGIKFFIDPEETDVKNFQVTGIDSDTGEYVTEDHWIEVRMDLSDLEWSELEAGVASRVNPEGEIMLDFGSLPTKELMKWVKGWSFYLNGRPANRTKPTEHHLGLLDRDIAKQIRAVIKGHIEERKAKRDAARNPTDAPAMVPVAATTGDSGTSATTSPMLTLVEPGTSSPLPADSEASTSE